MLSRILSKLLVLAPVLVALGTAPAQAQTPLRFCVFDPSGKAGDLYALSHTYMEEVSNLAGPTEIVAYSSEKVAEEDFKAGQCDGVALSTLRAKPFNTFVGSIDSIGSLPTDDGLRTVIDLLGKPALAPYMKQGAYEVVGVVPLGPLYVMVHDHRIDSVEKAAGKRVAVMAWDHWQSVLVEGLAAQPVESDINDFAAKFNNGQVDIIVAPALLFHQLELSKGIGSQGGIFRFPLAQLTATFLIHPERFPADFGQKFRSFVPTRLDDSFARIDQAESHIDSHYWLGLTGADQQRYTRLLQDARGKLTDAGYYDPRMMGVLKQVRCHLEPAAAECTFAAK